MAPCGIVLNFTFCKINFFEVARVSVDETVTHKWREPCSISANQFGSSYSTVLIISYGFLVIAKCHVCITYPLGNVGVCGGELFQKANNRPWIIAVP